MSPKKTPPDTPRPSTDNRRPTEPPGTEPELQVRELEERIMPRLAGNHNETLLPDA